MAERHPSQYVALATGAVFTLVGVLGFFVTGFDSFAEGPTGETLLGFELNPLHNIVHLVIGISGLTMWRQLDTARVFGWLLLLGYGMAFIYGISIDKASDANFLSLNGNDDGLHLASAIVGLVIAALPAAGSMRASSDDRRARRMRPGTLHARTR